MTNNELNLLVGLRLDDKNAKQQLAEFTKKKTTTVEIEIAGSKALQSISTYVNKVGQSFKALEFKDMFGNVDSEILNVSNAYNTLEKSTKRYVKSNGTVVTSIRNVNAEGEVAKDVTYEYIDAQNRLVTETKRFVGTLQEEKTGLKQVGDSVKQVSKAFQTITTTTNTIKTSVNDNGKSFDALQTTTERVSASGEKLRTVITSWTDAQGYAVEKTEQFNQANQKVADTLVKRTKNEAELQRLQKQRMQDTYQITTQQQSYVNGSKALVTTTQTLNSEGQKLTTVTTEYTNKMGYAVKEVQQFDENGKKVAGTMITMEKGAKSLGQSFGDIITKVAKFYLASLPIRAVQTMITQTISSVKEFDGALTEFRKVSSLSGDSLTSYVDKLGELGSTVARTTTEMIKSATEFKKAGYTDEESAELAQVASLYQNTADEILTASEATSVLVSQMKAFANQGIKAIEITDAINQVSQDFAISSGDIGKGLTQAGASLSTYGNSFEQTIGLVTAGTEIFQGKSQQVARGLNTVASRVAKNKDALAEYEVQVNDLVTGELRSTYDILADLKPKWDEMSSAEKVALGTTLAGVNQYKVFSAVMNNFNTAIEATDEAMNSEGATLRQNAVYMESLQAKLSMLKQEFQKFVLGDGGLSSFVKWLLNAGIAILKFANSDIGKLTIGFTLLSSVIKTVIVALTSGSNALGKFLLNSQILILSNGKLTFSFEALKTAIITNPLFVGLAIAGTIVALKKIGDALGITETKAEKMAKQTEKLKEKLEETKEEIEDNSNAYKDLTERLDDAKKKLEEYSKLKIENTDYYIALVRETQELQQQVDLLEQKLALERQEEEKTAKALYKQQTQTGVKSTYDPNGEADQVYGYLPVYQTPAEEMESVLAEYEKIQTIIKGYISRGEEVPTEWYNQLDTVKARAIELKETLLNIKGSIDGFDSATGEVDEEEQKILSTIDSLIGAFDLLYGKQEDSTDVTKEQEKEIEALRQQYNITDEQIQDYIEAHQNSTEETLTEADAIVALASEMESAEHQTQVLKEKLKELDKVELKDISDAFKNVSKAVNELNSANGLTLDTYESLMSLDVDYLSVLFDEEGNLRNTADAQRELYYAKIDNIGISQALLLIEKAEEVEANNGASAYVNYAKGIDTATNSMWGLVYAKIADANVSEASKSVLNKQVKSMENMANQAKKNYKAYTGGTSATKGHTGATKENTNALKENVEMLKKQKEALDDEVDKYEKVINYINSKLDDEIDRLEDLKDTEVDSIDARIDKLKDLADAKDDYYDKEIDKIKELKDQDKEYWNERIQALKDANAELEDQLELQKLLDALESAKKKKVMLYQKGKGFVYQTDQSAVSQAQKNLDEYYRKKNYQDQLKELEDQRDAQEKIYEKQIDDLEKKQKAEKDLYDQQIKDLENQKKKIEDKYDKLIKAFQDYKDKFKDQTNAYETEQNRLLALQLTGIDFENENWKTRLKNLDGFVSQYMEKQKQLATANELYKKAQEEYEAQQKVGADGATGYNIDLGSDLLTKSPDPYFIYKEIYSGASESTAKTKATQYHLDHKNEKVKAYYDTKSKKYIAMSYIGGGYTEQEASNQLTSLVSSNAKDASSYRIIQMSKWASGASSIDSDQMAIVGENPNKEIVIGSKLNNGVMAKLPKGSGVVNARSTNTLAGILNQLGFASSNFGIGSGNPINNDSSQNFIIENVTIDGANITDMNSFRNSLMNLKSEATQRAYRRK